MPIFEYKCQKCGNEFEELVFGDASPACPSCSSEKTEKLMSCCRHSSGQAIPGVYKGDSSSSGGGSACAGCSGGSCATCK